MIGIFGGTFDPVHLGHMHVAIEAYKQLGLQEVRLIPCRQSPFKDPPIASAQQRVEMLKLACENYPFLKIDQRELESDKISYTINTLLSLRAELPTTPLCFIISEDAFAKFKQWHNWEQILQLTHLAVANRPDSQPLDSVMNNFLTAHQVFDSQKLHQKLAGSIIMLPIKPLAISATEIRTAAKEGRKITGVNARVLAYINLYKIYQKTY